MYQMLLHDLKSFGQSFKINAESCDFLKTHCQNAQIITPNNKLTYLLFFSDAFPDQNPNYLTTIVPNFR